MYNFCSVRTIEIPYVPLLLTYKNMQNQASQKKFNSSCGFVHTIEMPYENFICDECTDLDIHLFSIEFR